MPKKVGKLKLHMGPRQVGGPDDLLRAIVGFIDGAKRKLDIAVQELDNREIADAIIRAKQRKVNVRLVLEGDYLKVDKPRPKPFQSGGKNEANRILHDAILRSAIQVHSDFNPKIFHQKFIVRDKSAVLTGSTNFTDTGVTKNLNHLVEVHDRKVAKAYTQEFKEIQNGRFGKLSLSHGPVPKNVTVSGLRTRVLFAPDHNPEMEIMKQMLKAKRRIDFAIFTFSKSSGIDDTMIALAKKGKIKIRGALESSAANQKWAATRPVRNAGAQLWRVPKGNGVGKLHHKLMVIDDQVVIAGSFNYTGPANLFNDENILVIGDLAATTKRIRDRQRRCAQYARFEIDRIIKDFGIKI
ncbi:MAG: phospholipase D-like domain-containing protein [Planctomycetota bacterium]